MSEGRATDLPDEFAARAEPALANEFLRRAVRFTVERLRNGKARAEAELGVAAQNDGEWEALRERARVVRAHVVENLDHYLDVFARRVEERGGHVHFCADAAEACAAVVEIARANGVQLAAKSKSMVTEEIHLNHELESAGIEALETDLGEWIIQLAEEMPSHIILPAIHKSRGDVQKLFEEHAGAHMSDDTATLAGYARRVLRKRFLEADMGISGCNFAIAETGSIAIFTNEGNGRMVTSLPRVHVALMGMERILPTLADLELLAQLLPRSATGQKLTTYLNVISGPARAGEHDGPRELHVVVLDNGRSAVLGDESFQDVLACIRCGACLNVCPVYRQVGGHAYGSVYPGPIGAVLTPLLERDSAAANDLANASSLCGACHDACPVKIPLHDMLVDLRRRNVDEGRTPFGERLAMRVAGQVLASQSTYAAGGALARVVQRLAFGDGSRRLGLAAWLAPLAGWTEQRDLPVPPKKAFRDLWPELERGARRGDPA